ncbi:helix-turn-helix domain-containing protein [Flaviflagellibacter deserti]|uniref:Helix-turn-helix domain-containing protein n=1 Tax=Flaviflagellibacter deserti TaxID=2267266 RepID=A0ABV9YZN0_9HYPH
MRIHSAEPMAPTPRQKRLSELLAEQRQKTGLKQVEVAKELGRHQPFIANIESGQRRVDLVELIAIADIIGLDLAEVIRELRKIPP